MNRLITLALITVGTGTACGGTAKNDHAERVKPASLPSAATAGPLAIDPQGNIVVPQFLGRDVAIQRFTPNGARDSRFPVVAVAGSKYAPPVAMVAIQRDGKIVLFGRIVSRPPPEPKYDPQAYDLALARYLANGRLDPTFGSNGRIVTHLDRDLAGGAVGPDGTIVVVGSSIGPAANSAPKILRFRVDGRIWGEARTVSQGYYPKAVGALQGDGKVVIAVPGPYGPMGLKMVIVRHLPDGRFDRSFARGRRYEDPYGNTWPNAVVNEAFAASAMTVQRDGKIVIAGDGGLVRYSAAGRLDRSFGSGGEVVSFDPGDPGSFGALAIQRDGRIVAGGSKAESGGFALARYTEDGQSDPTFGDGGKVTNRALGPVDGIALQGDNVVVSAPSRSGRVLVRYTSAGKLDTRFGKDGTVTLIRTRAR